jgi:hypothetical protein
LTARKRLAGRYLVLRTRREIYTTERHSFLNVVSELRFKILCPNWWISTNGGFVGFHERATNEFDIKGTISRIFRFHYIN